MKAYLLGASNFNVQVKIYDGLLKPLMLVIVVHSHIKLSRMGFNT